MTRQAYALDVFLAEINAHAPNRSKASDGGLGDPAHAARVSDHNPNKAGVWRARDVTNDVPGGMVCGELATLLVRKLGSHPALMSGAYIIWNGRIISYDRRGEGWRPYSGDNPHTRHLHLSVSTAAAGYDSRQPWNLYPLPPTRITRARKLLADVDELLADAAASAGPARRAKIAAGRTALRAVLAALPKR